MEMSTHTMVRVMFEHGEAVDIYNAINNIDMLELSTEERDSLSKFREVLELYI